DSPSSCSRSSEPSLSVKRRTQPILSAGCARSIELAAAAGCQRSKPLKSRSTFHTAPVGASRIVLLTMCGTSASEGPFECVEAALEHPAANIVDEFGFALGRAIKFGRPLQKGVVAVGHRRQP